MPLRRWFREHGHPGWYSWVVVVGMTITSVILAVVLSLRLLTRSSDGQRRSTCAVVVAQDNVFQEEPPRTEAGRKAADAWHDLRTSLRCDEPVK